MMPQLAQRPQDRVEVTGSVPDRRSRVVWCKRAFERLHFGARHRSDGDLGLGCLGDAFVLAPWR